MTVITVIHQINQSGLPAGTRSHALALLALCHHDNGHVAARWDELAGAFNVNNLAVVRRHLGRMQGVSLIHYSSADDVVYINFKAWQGAPATPKARVDDTETVAPARAPTETERVGDTETVAPARAPTETERVGDTETVAPARAVTAPDYILRSISSIEDIDYYGAAAPPPPPPATPPDDNDLPGWQEPPEPKQPARVCSPVRSMADAPPIAIYRDIFLRTPSKAQMQLLLNAGVADLHQWSETLTYWCGRGWNLTNVAGMLDLYSHPERMTDARPNASAQQPNHHRGGGSKQSATAASRPAWADYNPEPWDAEYARELGQL